MTKRSVEAIIEDMVHAIVANDGDYACSYFYYAEFEDGVVAPVLLQDVGDTLIYLPTDSFWELEFELNELSTPQPIGAITLDIEGDSFKAAFDYEIKVDENTDVRSTATIKKRFGDKPIIYPNLPGPREDS